MTVIERFLKYVSFDTQSDENSGATPSTPKQMVFAQYLRSELEQLGFQEISLDENGYLFATWPANTDKPVPTIGFIAHMDTSPDMTGAGVTPRIVYGYDGTDIVLCEEDNIILSPKQFPELLDHKGEDLIVTNGKTLLGADDKAGIAEIISAMVYLKEHPEIKHGKIRVGFNPDEEIGLGAHKFDVERFGCEWAYTMDGGEVGELEFENFNAASAKVIIKGRNVHPGYAKDKMINSLRVANEFVSLLPTDEVPECTDGYQGFYHLIDMNGDVSHATLHYIVRDHDRGVFEAKKQTLRLIAKNMNEKWGNGCVTLTITDQYQNMAEIIKDCPHLIKNAKKACENAGVAPLVLPIRGGTDGCQLSFRGLPCPNLGTGGHAYHGPYEHISVEGMDMCVDIVVELIKLYTEGC